MMNYIWSAIFLAAFLYACITGRMELFSQALTESSADAVEFIIRLAGIMAMWSGLMEIAERTELISKMSRLLLPFTTFLFPRLRNPDILPVRHRVRHRVVQVGHLLQIPAAEQVFAAVYRRAAGRRSGCGPAEPGE